MLLLGIFSQLMLRTKMTPVTSSKVVEGLAKELEIVKDACSRAASRKKGDNVFLIAEKWWRNWELYAGGDHWFSTPAGEPALHPGPINNLTLINDGIGELKPSLSEARDFTVVPENAWDLLVQHYGVSSKWPIAIRRKVIASSYYSTLNKVEAYPLKIDIRLHTELSNPHTIPFSRGGTISELMKMARILLDIPEKKEIQIWYRSDSLTPVERLTLAENGEETLQKLEATNGSLFIIETRDDDFDIWDSSKPEFAERARVYGIKIKAPETSTSLPPPYSSTTPNLAISNDFEGNVRMKGTGIKGLCGLLNLGNTCFMNSAIQCLSNIPDLTKFFLSGEYKGRINRENKLGTKGELVEKYAALIEALWSGEYTSVSPRAFKSAIGQFAPRFVGYAQQDSTEIMSFILEGLHEDLNEVTVKPYHEIEEKENLSDSERGQEFWDYHRKRNASKIVDLFHGQLKSTLTCNVCQKVFLTFDPFCYLSVPLPKPTKRKFTGHFRYADPSRTVANLQLAIPIDFNLKDIREAFASQTKIEPERIKVCTVSKAANAALTHFYAENATSIYIHTSYDDLMGFEVAESDNQGDENEQLSVVLYVKTHDFFKVFPFFWTTKKSGLNSAVLHKKVLSIIGAFRKPESVEEPLTGYQLRHVSLSGMAEREDIPADREDDAEELEKNVFGRCLYILIKWDAENSHLDFDRMATPDFSRLVVKPESDLVRLADCFSLFLNEEQLSEQNSWYCPRCKSHQRAFKKLDLWRLPMYLIIQLKRFDQGEGLKTPEKLDTLVRYPFNLDLSELLTASTSDNSSYDLIAVSNHFGSMAYGHYSAYAINETTGNWYLFDDSNVEIVASKDDVISDAGYLLIYKRHEKTETNKENES